MEANTEVGEEGFDFGDSLAPDPERPDEDLRIRRGGHQQLVVLVLGESCHRRIVKRIVRIEKGDDDRRVEDD